MGSDWVLGRLGDHVDACLGKMLDQKKNKGELHPYIGNKNVRWGSFELDDLLEMRFEDHEHERYGLQYGDLVVCEGGVPGRCAIWKNEIPNMKIQKALHRIRTHKSLNNYYLHYWFTWSGNNGLLDAYFTGTTIKHLSGKALSNIEIPIPPIEIQERIARILGSLDDKIELNRQMNETLEAMAQALFKSWFVDFDPVLDNALAAGNPIPDELSARAEQRQALPPSDSDNHAIRALFPDAFEFTEEMGWIPRGWGFTEVGKILNRLKTKVKYKKDDVSDYGKVPVYEQGSGILLGFHNNEPDIKASNENPAFIFGDHTCVTKLSLESFSISANVIPLRGKNYPTIWVYYAVHDKQSFEEYRRHWMEFVIKPVISPSLKLTEIFSKHIESFGAKQMNIQYQNQTLAKLRDTLLPKLLSGELRISDAAAMVDKV